MPKSITVILRLIIVAEKSNYYDIASVRLSAAIVSVDPIVWISVKFNFGDLYDNLFRKSNFHKSGQKFGNVHAEIIMFYCCRRYGFHM